jgi:HSP20 family molecular chaperone IbpA
MQLNQSLESAHPTAAMEPSEQSGPVFTPEVDIIEAPDRYVLDVYMPGVTEQTAEVTLENDVLTIRGKVQPSIGQSHRLVYQEYQVGDYRRVFTLSEDVDRDHMSATVRDGVLHLIVPKAEGSKAKRIEVKAA